MSYNQIIQRLPVEWQMPIGELADAIEQHLRDELAVRRSDFDELKAVVYDLTEAQKHSEQRLGHLESIARELAEAQKRTEHRIEELAEAQKRTEQRVEELAEAQKHTEQRLGRLESTVQELVEAQKHTEHILAELLEAQKRTDRQLRFLTNKVSKIDGRSLELIYREKASAYFGPLLRCLRVVPPHTLEDSLETQLSHEDFLDVLRLDLMVSGKPRHASAEFAESEVYLAVEISAVIDHHDVSRARWRASGLRKAGYHAIPVVAGESLTTDAEEQTRQLSIVVLEDEKIRFWQEALNTWLKRESTTTNLEKSE